MISKDTARRIGAIAGLIIGILVMRATGYSGIMASAVFGASFCVVGAMIGERI